MFRTLEEYHLPRMITEVTGQAKVPFGDGVLATQDTVIGTVSFAETSEPELPMSS